MLKQIENDFFYTNIGMFPHYYQGAWDEFRAHVRKIEEEIVGTDLKEALANIK